MSKYYKSSNYCPDDKDILDFLNASGAGNDNIISYLRKNGIFVSGRDRKSEVIEYLASLNLSWMQLGALVDIIDLPEVEDYLSNETVPLDASVTELQDCLTALIKVRADKERETYNVEPTLLGLAIYVKYVEIDYSRTRVIQKRQRVLQVLVERAEAGKILFRFTNNDRAKQIVQGLSGLIAEAKSVSADAITRGTITLSSIRQPGKRVQFFLKLMNGMQGYPMRSVTSVKVERLENRSPSVGDEEEDAKEDLAERVKKIILQGENLLLTPEYQDLVSKGYFISHVQWQAEELGSHGDRVDFAAGFSDPQVCSDFIYKIVGKYYIDDDGSIMKRRSKIPASLKHEIARTFEASAQAARASLDLQQ